MQLGFLSILNLSCTLWICSNHFRNYVELCYKEFGDRVKHWITINEPWSYSYGGYTRGFLAPGRCSAWQQLNCTGGNSATEPYLVAHNLLLAHAAAVKLYKNKYQVIPFSFGGFEYRVPIENILSHRFYFIIYKEGIICKVGDKQRIKFSGYNI